MGMPPMPPGMMPQGYGFPPMGMMPMGMPGMMPPMPPRPAGAPTNFNATNNKPSKKLVPQEIPKGNDEEKPPVTTVFVGNISERAPDAMIKQMLLRCGNVLSWKRVQGASGKLQAFGFCEYESPEATLRCIRLLNEWQIADKKLVVKVDAKTKTQLEEYKRKKKSKEQKDNNSAENSNQEEGEVEDNVPDELDEFTLREDRVATAGLDAIMREYSADLAKEPATDEKKKERNVERRKEKKEDGTVKDTTLDGMELEDDKKSLISREIRSFRDAHKVQ